MLRISRMSVNEKDNTTTKIELRIRLETATLGK